MITSLYVWKKIISKKFIVHRSVFILVFRIIWDNIQKSKHSK